MIQVSRKARRFKDLKPPGLRFGAIRIFLVSIATRKVGQGKDYCVPAAHKMQLGKHLHDVGNQIGQCVVAIRSRVEQLRVCLRHLSNHEVLKTCGAVEYLTLVEDQPLDLRN